MVEKFQTLIQRFSLKKLSSKSNKLLNVSFVTKRKIGNATKRNKLKED